MVDDGFDFHRREIVVERKRDGSVGDVFRQREVAFFEAVIGHVKGLKMDGWEVVGAADVMGAEIAEDGVAVCAVEIAGETDDEDKPAHDGLFVDGGEDDVGFVEEGADVIVGDPLAGFDDFVEAFHLDDADGGVDVAEAVVVAEAGVGEPTAAGIAALVAETAAHVGELAIVGDDHAAFAGGDLLVGIEAEDAAAAEGSDFAFFVAAAEAFAGVFDEGDFVAGCELGEIVHAGGIAEGFDGEDGFGFRRDRLLGFLHIHVERGAFDIDEDGGRADHLDDVGGGDEGKGGGDDLVAGADF